MLNRVSAMKANYYLYTVRACKSPLPTHVSVGYFLTQENRQLYYIAATLEIVPFASKVLF